eukprot:Hpha_TRINITY_DN3302_c0_g1::TRINITY_DN3302_c0_g1_i1::g.172466::m.172466
MSAGRKVSVQQLQALLSPELRAVGQEASRRHPPLKEACEQAAVRLAVFGPADSEVALLQSAEELWRPLLIACDCKHGRLAGSAVGALTKLVQHGYVLPGAAGDIVAVLAKLRDVQEEQVQLRVLQCITALFSARPASGSYDFTPQQLVAVLSLAFWLHAERRHAVVQSTAAATIEQLSGALFQRLGTRDSTAAAQAGAYLVLKELCLIAGGELGQCVKSPTEASRALALDIIHGVVSAHHQHLAALPSFVTLAKEDLSLLLHEQFRTAADPPTVARLCRLASGVMLRFLHELQQQAERFIEVMSGLVDHGAPWQGLVVLCCWRDLAESHSFLRLLYERFDATPRRAPLFKNFVGTAVRCIQRHFPEVRQTLALSGERTPVARFVALRSDEDPASLVRRSEPVAWAVEVVAAVSKSLARLVELEGRSLTDGEVQNDVAEQKGVVAAAMLEAVWVPLRASCAMLLEGAVDEEVVEETLKCLKQLTHACGKANLANARDAFIITMTEQAVPQRPPLTRKHEQVLKVLFHVASSLGGVLGNSWGVLLRAFQGLEVVLSAPGVDQGQGDVGVVRSMLGRVFEATRYLPSEGLQSIVQALVATSGGGQQQGGKGQAVASQGSSAAGFAISRMADVCVANVARLHEVWPTVRQHFAAAVRDCPEEQLRRCALSAAQQIVLAYLSHAKQLREQPDTAPGNAQGSDEPPAAWWDLCSRRHSSCCVTCGWLSTPMCVSGHWTCSSTCCSARGRN